MADRIPFMLGKPERPSLSRRKEACKRGVDSQLLLLDRLKRVYSVHDAQRTDELMQDCIRAQEAYQKALREKRENELVFRSYYRQHGICEQLVTFLQYCENDLDEETDKGFVCRYARNNLLHAALTQTKQLCCERDGFVNEVLSPVTRADIMKLAGCYDADKQIEAAQRRLRALRGKIEEEVSDDGIAAVETELRKLSVVSDEVKVGASVHAARLEALAADLREKTAQLHAAAGIGDADALMNALARLLTEERLSDLEVTEAATLSEYAARLKTFAAVLRREVTDRWPPAEKNRTY